MSRGKTSIGASFGGQSSAVDLEVSAGQVTGLTVQTLVANGPTSVGVGQPLSLQALASFSAGPTEDVSAQATWTSDTPGVATVSQGVVTGVSPGQATISASFQGVTGKLLVTVLGGGGGGAVRSSLVLDKAGTYTFNT